MVPRLVALSLLACAWWAFTDLKRQAGIYYGEDPGYYRRHVQVHYGDEPGHVDY